MPQNHPLPVLDPVAPLDPAFAPNAPVDLDYARRHPPVPREAPACMPRHPL